MKMLEVTMMRIYLTEGQHLVEFLLKRLHDQEKVRGVTVFRGISGFGQSGKSKMHSTTGSFFRLAIGGGVFWLKNNILPAPLDRRIYNLCWIRDY